MTSLIPTSGFGALSEQQQADHRLKVGIRVRAILSGFWVDHDTIDAQQAMEVEGWVDVLEQCSHSEIRYAWRDYQTDRKNRTERGRLAKPDAGALFRIILSKRTQAPSQKAVEKRETIAEDRVDPARAQQILDEEGFNRLTGFGTVPVKGFPRSPITPKSHLKWEE
jgi:hypothetical protein